MENEFRSAGDDPEKPYVLKGSFTGEAATNIEGRYFRFKTRFGPLQVEK